MEREPAAPVPEPRAQAGSSAESASSSARSASSLRQPSAARDLGHVAGTGSTRPTSARSSSSTVLRIRRSLTALRPRRLGRARRGAELLEAARPRRPDRADRHLERGADLLVARLARRRAAAGAPGSARSSLANARHRALSRSRRAARARRLVRRRVEESSLVARELAPAQPDVAQRLAAGRGREPAAEPSGSLMRSRFSTSRSQVVCATSAASACDSRCARAVAQTRPWKRSTIVFQAAPSPWAAARTRSSRLVSIFQRRT